MAAWPHDVTNPLPLIANVNDHSAPPLATLPDGSGGFFVAVSVSAGGPTQLFLQRITSAGTASPGWPGAGVAMSTAQGQGAVRLVTDGAGGVIAVWQDFRAGHTDIYAQRVTANGTIAGGWPVGGLGVNTLPNDKYTMDACTDMSGGALVAFDYQFGVNDIDVLSAHVFGNATVTNGTVNNAVNLQQDVAICSNGVGGCFVAFADNSAGNYDLKCSELNSNLVALFSNKIMCDEPSDQRSPTIVHSGQYGIVYWTDGRFGSYYQIMYDYLTTSGTTGYHFGFNLYSTTTTQVFPTTIPDNSGGYYVEWSDGRQPSGLYVQHYLTALTPYVGWPVGGVRIAAGPGNQNWDFAMAIDTNNGLITAWSDPAPTGAIYASHFDAYGVARPLCSSAGTIVAYDHGYSSYVNLVPDGRDGAFLAFTDSHLGTMAEYGQRLDQYLALGEPGPVSAGIKDIKADQGGHVRVTWNATYLDNLQSFGIGSYWVWRQAPITLAQAAARSGSSALFRPASAPGVNYAWEFLAQQPANQSAQYSYVAPTTTDSITGHNPYTVFMVEAHAASDSRAFWQSAPDSGYSVDNLAPSTPAPFLGNYANGNTSMNWGPNGEGDLYGYRLYRGTTVGFTPSPGNRIAEPTSTAYVDAAPPSIYKLTAIDVHGNESLPATLIPSGTSAVESDLPRELSFALVSANPSRGAASFRLALPRAAGVTLVIYDVGGRQVREITRSTLAAGTHPLAWDGRETSGDRAPSGIYLAQLRAEDREFVTRIVLAR